MRKSADRFIEIVEIEGLPIYFGDFCGLQKGDRSALR